MRGARAVGGACVCVQRERGEGGRRGDGDTVRRRGGLLGGLAGWLAGRAGWLALALVLVEGGAGARGRGGAVVWRYTPPLARAQTNR